MEIFIKSEIRKSHLVVKSIGILSAKNPKDKCLFFFFQIYLFIFTSQVSFVSLICISIVRAL